MKPTICIDFDGVLHSYESGWQGIAVIPDSPVKGAIEWLLELLRDGMQPAIYSSRSSSLRGRRAMKAWLKDAAFGVWLQASAAMMYSRAPEIKNWADGIIHGFEVAGWEFSMGDEPEEAHYAGRALVKACAWPWFKPPALVTVDDRAICFDGTFPAPADLRAFKPWYKRR